REEGDRQQGVVLDDAEYPQGQRLEQTGRKQPGFHAEEAEQQAAGGEREGDRETGEQEQQQRAEHQFGRMGGEEFDHFCTSPAWLSGVWSPGSVSACGSCAPCSSG